VLGLLDDDALQSRTISKLAVLKNANLIQLLMAVMSLLPFINTSVHLNFNRLYFLNYSFTHETWHTKLPVNLE